MSFSVSFSLFFFSLNRTFIMQSALEYFIVLALYKCYLLLLLLKPKRGQFQSLLFSLILQPVRINNPRAPLLGLAKSIYYTVCLCKETQALVRVCLVYYHYHLVQFSYFSAVQFIF